MVPGWFYYRSRSRCEPWLNPSRAAQPDIGIVPLLLSHPKVLPVSTGWSRGESLFKSAHKLLWNKLIFQVSDCLAGEKRLNYFHLMFLGDVTVSVVLRGRQHPSWLTAALLVICWRGSTLPRFWKTESSQGTAAFANPAKRCWGATQLDGCVYSACWSCSCRLTKYHLTASTWAFCWSLCNTLDFSIADFPCPRFDVFVPIANPWSLLAWVMGELGAGMVRGCPAAANQARAWPEESSRGLQWGIFCLVAAVSTSKPVPGLMIFWVLYSKSFSGCFFFELLWFCCLFFHITCGLRVMLHSHQLCF